MLPHIRLPVARTAERGSTRARGRKRNREGARVRVCVCMCVHVCVWVGVCVCVGGCVHVWCGCVVERVRAHTHEQATDAGRGERPEVYQASLDSNRHAFKHPCRPKPPVQRVQIEAPKTCVALIHSRHTLARGVAIQGTLHPNSRRLIDVPLMRAPRRRVAVRRARARVRGT